MDSNKFDEIVNRAYKEVRDLFGNWMLTTSMVKLEQLIRSIALQVVDEAERPLVLQIGRMSASMRAAERLMSRARETTGPQLYVWDQGQHEHATGDSANQVVQPQATQATQATQEQLEPIPMLLWCPFCHERHVDVATTPHRTHECQNCGVRWAQADVPTVGVRSLSQER